MNPKIIATIGLVSENYETLKKLALEGMNIARVNFSHATQEQWFKIKNSLAKIKKETGISVEIMADLQGPRIRFGKLPQDIKIIKGQVYALTLQNPDYTNNELLIDYPTLYKFVKKGEPLFLSNKLIELRVEKVTGKKIYAKALQNGIVSSRKGINIPETTIKNTLGKKDKEDAIFASNNGADYLSLSFVQEASDIEELKSVIKNKKVDIIAKIERAKAIDNIDGIIKISDGIMIARGDLGIEMPIEELCIIQKNLIRHAHQYNKPAIVATQMLDSMTKNPFPTRAEAADVANAIFDGADATMLSDETASGIYPVESVIMMKKIIKKVDEYYNSTNYFEHIKH